MGRREFLPTSTRSVSERLRPYEAVGWNSIRRRIRTRIASLILGRPGPPGPATPIKAETRAMPDDGVWIRNDELGLRGTRVAAAGPGQSDAASDVELGAPSANLLAQGQYFEGGVGEPAEEDTSEEEEKDDQSTLVPHSNRAQTRRRRRHCTRKPLNQQQVSSRYTGLPRQPTALPIQCFFSSFCLACRGRLGVSYASERAPESPEPSWSSTV
jgi:hypothetical protein